MAEETIEQAAPTTRDTKRFQWYKVRTGMFAWMFHRITGVALVAYLILHIWELRALSDRDAFNTLITYYHAPVYKLGEFLLLGAVVYHALNGLRIVLIDFLGWSPNQRRLFWTLGAVAFVIMVVGGYPIIATLVNHLFG